MTSLANPVSVATAGVAFHEECGNSVVVPSGSVCNYDDYFYDGHFDDKPDYFDYDDPDDFDSYPSLYGFVGPDNYELYHDLHGPDDCVSQGDVGVLPYWSGDEEGDVDEGDVALTRTGSDEPVNSVVSTSGLGGPGGPGGLCDEVCEYFPRTGYPHNYCIRGYWRVQGFALM